MKLVKLNTPADFDKSVIPANNILLFVDGSQGSPVLTYKDSAGEFHTFCTGISPSSEESDSPSEEPSISSIDPYLLPENIKYGVTIEGVVGTFTQGATATSSTILNGYTAYADGQVVVGTIQTVTATQSSNVVTVPTGYIASQQTITVGTALASTTYTPTTSDQVIATDTYITGVQTIKGDANLVAANIKDGVSIFGVTGTYTSGATATASTILSGYTAYANGELITGEYVCPEISSESSAGVEEDVILGVVDAQGKFQPFSFSGTTPTNSGTAETVSNYNTWNSTLPSPTPTPSGSVDYYKCASVNTSNHTWTGYKAVLSGGIYTFESSVTSSGLTYTSPVPVPGLVYNADCSIRAILIHTALTYLRNLPFSSNYEDTVLHDTPISSGGEYSITNSALVFPDYGANYIKYTALSQQPDAFSIVFWIKYGEYNESNNTPIMFGNELNESQTSFFRFPYAGTFRMGVQDTTGNNYTYDTTAIDYTSWTLVSVVFSGTDYYIYLNGILIATVTSSTPILLTRNLWFGSYYGYNDEHTFKGDLRGFRIIDSAISTEQVQAIYEMEA